MSVVATAAALRATPASFTESDFRASLGAADTVRLSYRGLDCQPLGFDEFARAMGETGVHSDIERAVDGTAITVTVRRQGGDDLFLALSTGGRSCRRSSCAISRASA